MKHLQPSKDSDDKQLKREFGPLQPLVDWTRALYGTLLVMAKCIRYLMDRDLKLNGPEKYWELSAQLDDQISQLEILCR